MNDAHAITFRHSAIRIWLMTVAGLIFVMVLVGGVTRITESGLSIVEWQPVSGVLPPMSDAVWQAEFEKYKTIPQYRERNLGMSLEAFKAIYWWEWAHRLLGRVIGVVFFLPFLFFWLRGWIESGLRARLWAIFGLGAVQGAVGWWMVASGLTARVNVAHDRLAFHLTLACGIYAAVLWTAQGLRTPLQVKVPIRIRASAVALLCLVLVQICLGALVAGLRGGVVYNSWPLIDGAFVPSAERLLFLAPAWSNFFDNVLMVQFEHRVMAYLLLLLAILHAIDAAMYRSEAASSGASALVAGVTIQTGIGIFTLLHMTPLTLALLHQGMAIIVLTIAVLHAERLTARRAGIQGASLALPASVRASSAR
jgi:cytochrome c oxidase assembly protein subunit 15